MPFDKEISFRTLALGGAIAAAIAQQVPAVAPHKELIGFAIGAAIGWAYDRIMFALKGGSE